MREAQLVRGHAAVIERPGRPAAEEQHRHNEGERAAAHGAKLEPQLRLIVTASPNSTSSSGSSDNGYSNAHRQIVQLGTPLSRMTAKRVRAFVDGYKWGGTTGMSAGSASGKGKGNGKSQN